MIILFKNIIHKDVYCQEIKIFCIRATTQIQLCRQNLGTCLWSHKISSQQGID